MGNTSDILQVQGVNAKGFGTIPKLVMQDRRLTVEAKAIYAYFCSYAGAGKTAFPSCDRIIYDLKISKSRFYTHFNKIKEYGYIKVEQEKDRKGKFKRNIYTLIDTLPCPNFPYTGSPSTDYPYTENKDININSIKNNNIYNNHVLSSQSEKEDRQDATDENKIQAYTEIIKGNISYDNLAISHNSDLKLIDEMILIILDAILTEAKIVRISNEDKPRALVTSVLMQLT